MRRRIIVTLLGLIVVAEVGIIFAQSQQDGLPPEAQSALNRYLASENLVSSQPSSVVQLAYASRPDRFEAAFSTASVGGNFYLRTTRVYRSAATPNPLISATWPVTAGSFESPREGRALSFPPKDLWCVLLHQEGGSGRVVYLALHEDLYNADWIVHETAGSPGDALLGARLASVGCNLAN